MDWGVASCAGYEACVTGSFQGRKGECLTTDRLLASEQWHSLVKELMFEVIASGNAFGLKISTDLAQDLIDKTKIMSAYKPSTLVDFERASPVELDSLSPIIRFPIWSWFCAQTTNWRSDVPTVGCPCRAFR